MKKPVAYVSGDRGKGYVLHVPELSPFRHLNGVGFAVYRQAQHIANAIKAFDKK